MRLGPGLDAARARVVEHDLTAQAAGQLTEVVSGLSLEARADAVGPGDGGRHHQLEPGLALVWGWEEGRFRLRVEPDGPDAHDG